MSGCLGKECIRLSGELRRIFAYSATPLALLSLFNQEEGTKRNGLRGMDQEERIKRNGSRGTDQEEWIKGKSIGSYQH